MSVAKLCEQYGFQYESMPYYIKIKSKFGVWYVEKGLDFTKEELELFHENLFDKQDYRKNKSSRNNFDLNRNSSWHKQNTKKMTIEEAFSYICNHDLKYTV